MAKDDREYALYHGENFIDIGTADKLAKEMGWSEQFVRWLSYPTAMRRYDESNGNRYIAVKLTDDKEEE